MSALVPCIDRSLPLFERLLWITHAPLPLQVLLRRFALVRWNMLLRPLSERRQSRECQLVGREPMPCQQCEEPGQQIRCLRLRECLPRRLRMEPPGSRLVLFAKHRRDPHGEFVAPLNVGAIGHVHKDAIPECRIGFIAECGPAALHKIAFIFSARTECKGDRLVGGFGAFFVSVEPVPYRFIGCI